LKLNHIDYQDIKYSEDNLHKYPENRTPVVINYRQSILNRDKEAMSVHDNEEEEGVESGDCSFVVHDLTGEEFSAMTLETIKARALEHHTKDGKIAFVGHAPQPESIYNNPQLFPSMMPWLFPYGLGGIGFLFFIFLNQQFITWCAIAVHGKPYKTKYSLWVYTCKIGRDTAALTSPFRAVMSPAHVKHGQENDKEYWALRRLPKPALAPDTNHPHHTQSTPKDVPSRSQTRVYLVT
jgi:hypothetical protein